MFNKLEEIMEQLPPIVIDSKEYKPLFRYGTRSQLTADLSLTRKAGERYYPLVFLETPFEITEEVDLRFILATANGKTDMRNKDRIDLTFGQVLEPLRDNLYHALLRSGIFKRTPATPYDEYKGEYFFDFHMTPDIWDALIYETTFRYTPDCKVKTIYFKS